jgi:hypothetical protein
MKYDEFVFCYNYLTIIFSLSLKFILVSIRNSNKFTLIYYYLLLQN